MQHSPAYLNRVIDRYRSAFRIPGFAGQFFVGSLMLGASWFVNYFAILFATEHASNSVTDIVLSNIPVWNVADFFVYGTFVLGAFSFIIVLLHPKRVPFAFKVVALFWVIRSAFTALTHVAPFETQYESSFGPAITHMFFGGDLFFSAHTGMPFLGALAFWHQKGLRNLYLLGSIYFAVVVLLGHLHYTVDVASAFFITYGIFEIGKLIFAAEHRLFYSAKDETI